MTDREKQTLAGVGSALAMAFLGTVALAVTGLLIVGGLAANKSRYVERRWEESLGAPAELFARYPRTDANASALELERLTLRLGLDITPRFRDRGERPGRPSKSLLAFKRSLSRWFDAQLGHPYRGIDEPPAEVTSFLDRYAVELEAVRRHLIEEEVPVWESQFDRLFEAPVPNLLGHLDLQKLLLADALARSRKGDADVALRDLEASWKLNRSLRDAPVVITQLIAVSVTRTQAGALRQLESVPGLWRDRLQEHDHRASLLNALRVEGWTWSTWSKIPDPSLFGADLGMVERFAARVAKPYLTYCVADVSGTFRERIENLARLDVLCDTDLERYGANLDIPVPAWNLIGEAIVPNLNNAVQRIARLELDLELTAKVLELDEARRTGRTVSLPGLVESRACPGDRWNYEVATDGTARIAFSRRIEWDDQIGLMLPTEFSL